MSAAKIAASLRSTGWTGTPGSSLGRVYREAQPLRDLSGGVMVVRSHGPDRPLSGGAAHPAAGSLESVEVEPCRWLDGRMKVRFRRKAVARPKPSCLAAH